MTGCDDQTQPAPRAVSETATTVSSPQDYLFKNDVFGLVVLPNSDWHMDTQEVGDTLKLTFQHEGVRAIVSSVSGAHTFDTVKAELLSGAGDVDILVDDGQSLSYRSKLKSAIQTNISFKAHPNGHNFVIIFMFPMVDDDATQPIRENLLNHIILE